MRMPLNVALQKNLPPYAKQLGITITEATSDKIVAELLVTEAHSNGLGTMHGGALMAWADTMGAIGTIVNIPRSAQTTTLESKTNFVSAGRVGTVLTAEATPIHRGKTTQVWQTRITRPDGKLVALITQTQLVMGA